MNLRHIWGDANCGDDFVGDTPPQYGATTNCPTGQPISCNNGPNGDMFMNYMDYTYDACMNLFTSGQRQRSKALFATVNGVDGVRVGQLNNFFGFSGQPTSIICPTTYTVSPLCLSINWTVNGPAIMASGSNTNQIVLQPTGSGTATLTAISGNYTASIDIAVSIGSPTIPNGICGPGNICYKRGVTGTASVCTPVQGLTYSWQIDGQGVGSGTSISINPLIWDVGTHTIAVRSYLQGCNTYSLWKTGTFTITNCTTMSAYTVAPNPASSTVEVSSNAVSTDIDQHAITEVNLYDQQGNIQKHVKFNKVKKGNVNVSNLKNGIYFIEVADGAFKERQQIQVLKN